MHEVSNSIPHRCANTYTSYHVVFLFISLCWSNSLISVIVSFSFIAIGHTMLTQPNYFPEFKKDWSDHALWWPTRNKWLSRPKHTLDQYGVHADAALHFTPMHKSLRIQLPDLRFIDCRIDFSIDTFSAVVHLCKSLGEYMYKSYDNLKRLIEKS